MLRNIYELWLFNPTSTSDPAQCSVERIILSDKWLEVVLLANLSLMIFNLLNVRSHSIDDVAVARILYASGRREKTESNLFSKMYEYAPPWSYSLYTVEPSRNLSCLVSCLAAPEQTSAAQIAKA